MFLIQKLTVEFTCRQDKRDEDMFAWNKIMPDIMKLLELGATAGKFEKVASVSDYGGGSETYNYKVEWRLESE